jgi:hypothetical protein
VPFARRLFGKQLGIAELTSAQALDGSVVLRATISVPEMTPRGYLRAR